MTQPIRFLFDECLARPVVESQLKASLALYGSDAEIAHLMGKVPSGTIDAVWVPQIAQEGGWIIVTCDRGKHSKIGHKLPQICRAFGVTHVMLSAGLNKRNMYYNFLSAHLVFIFPEFPDGGKLAAVVLDG